MSLFLSCQTSFENPHKLLGLLDTIEKYTMSRFPIGTVQHELLLDFFKKHMRSDSSTLHAIREKPFSQHASWGAETSPASLGQFFEDFCAELDAYLSASKYELRCQQLEWFKQKLIENLEQYRGNHADTGFNQLYDSVMSSLNPALEQERANTANSSAILNQL